MSKGKLIVLDGTDSTGKTDQTALLLARLKREKMPAISISFPRYETPTGQRVAAYLEGRLGTLKEVSARDASRLFADDRKATASEICAWLEYGTHVIANRYVASNMGYQGAKIVDDAERQKFYAWNEALEYKENKLPRPDLNLILHLPLVVSLALMNHRGRMKDIHESDPVYLQRANDIYLEISHLFPGFTVIDCATEDQCDILSRECIHERIWIHVAPLIGA